MRTSARNRLIVALTVGAAVTVPLAACGSDDDESASTDTGGADATTAAPGITVSETEYKLTPANVDFDGGSVTIEAKNDGKIVHALEVEGSGIEEKTDDIEPGKSAELTADLKPGTYEWYCPIANHRELGMEGKITVAGGASTSTTPTTDDKGGEDSGGTKGPDDDAEGGGGSGSGGGSSGGKGSSGGGSSGGSGGYGY